MHIYLKMSVSMNGSERRRWERLPLAIPVFVRGIEPNGKQFIEFATALDISVGGALLAIQRHLPPGSRIMLEIPCTPVPLAKNSQQNQNFKAKLVRVTKGDDCHLLGLKFHRPMGSKTAPKRKKSAAV
jgi:hypothetical protein